MKKTKIEYAYNDVPFLRKHVKRMIRIPSRYKKITKIKIPKGDECRKCIFRELIKLDIENLWCSFPAFRTKIKIKCGMMAYRCQECIKMFPDGATFVLKE